MKVELVTEHPYPDENGKPIPVLIPHFVIQDENGEDMRVPFDPLNRHYHEIKEWYGKQKKKPFKFDFENAKPE